MGRLAFFVIALAGCLEPALVPCGDLACPANAMCLVDRCVTAQQLASCEGHADGEGCSLDQAVGRCDAGACTLLGCGNGVIDGDELCDDGNLAYGDGCAGDCLSRETCGNGIVDVAESCDCGFDAGTKPARCRSPNADDPDAECTPACEARYCGDGIVDNLEACDGTELGAATCSDFGFYRGTPTCTGQCQLELTGCDGRCGDQIVEPAVGEFCDGAPPPGSCLTYGFDAGTVACSSACSTDVVACERFGWQRIDARPIVSVWGDAASTLVVSSLDDAGSNAWMVINGIRQLAPPGAYLVAAGSSSAAFAIGRTTTATWNGASWSAIVVPWSPAMVPTAASASDGLGLLVVASGEVWRYASGTWTAQSLAGITGVAVDAAGAHAWSSDTVWSSTTGEPGTWMTETLPGAIATPISSFVGSASGPVWLANGTSLSRRDNGTWTTISVAAAIKTARSTLAGDLFTVDALGVRRFDAAQLGSSEALQGPGSLDHVVVNSDGGLTIGGTLGAYRLRSGAWIASNLIYGCCAYLPYSNDFFTKITVTPDGHETVMGLGAGSMRPWDGTDHHLLPTYDHTRNIYGYLYDGTFLDGVEVFAHGNSGVTTDSDQQLMYGYYDVIDSSRDGEVLAGGPDQIARSSPSWQRFAITGTVIALSKDDAGVIYAAVSAEGEYRVIATTDGTDATIVLATPTALTDVWAAPNGEVFATGGSTVFHCVPGSACSSTPVSIVAKAISGTSPADMFVAGTPLDASASALYHLIGGAWTPVRVPSSKITDLDVSARQIAFVDGTAVVTRMARVARW